MRERTAKDGSTTYQVLFRDGGKQKGRTFATPQAAQDFSDALRVLGPKRALQELAGGPARGMTLNELAEKFFEWKLTRVRSDRTVADYRRDYDNWIKADLGWRSAADIDESDVQDWVDSMHGRLMAKSIHDRHAILHGIFKFGSAPRRALIPVGHNPAIGTDLPKKVRKPITAIRPGEWHALHAALVQIDPDAADLADFLNASGWRWSEAVALTTHDVEDDGRYVAVVVSQVARRQSDGSVKIVQDTKSEAGQRRERLDPDASAMVRRRVRGLAPGTLVFRTNGGSMWNYSHFRNRYWAKALNLANIERPLKIHWLRHLAVGQLDAAGVGIPKIQRRIGHEKVDTTIDVYGTMIDDIDDATLDRLAEVRRVGRAALPEVAFEIED